MASSFIVAQINLQKSRAASAELSKRQQYDLVLITEPMASKSGVKNIDKANVKIFTTKDNPRACIRVKNQINAWFVEEFSDRDMTTVSVKTEQGLVYFSSVYLDIELTTRKEKLMALVVHCKAKGTGLVIGADSNAHSILWGAEETNARGEDIEDWILSNDLCVMNRGVEHNFDSGRAEYN